MRRIALFLFIIPFFFLPGDAIGQFEVDTLEIKQINAQIWKPFMEAYANHDVELYLGLHTEDVLRATPWGLRTGDAFRAQIRKSWSRPNPARKQIEFRFEHRIHSDSIAYEVGYYQLTYPDNKPGEQVFLGRFHVVLNKINDQWYIAQDWDDNDINGRPVTVEDFNRLPDGCTNK